MEILTSSKEEQLPFVMVYLKTYGVVLVTKPVTMAMLPVGGKIAGTGAPAGRVTQLQLPVPGDGSFPMRKVLDTLHNN